MFEKWLKEICYAAYKMQHTLNMLARNQEKQVKLYEELKNALPDPDAPTTENTLAKMPFLRACVKETLRYETYFEIKIRLYCFKPCRMYPVIIGNGRSLTSDAIIGGYQVPKGVRKQFLTIIAKLKNEFYREEAI
jgi:cytochrome P450 family 49 subfamily A